MNNLLYKSQYGFCNLHTTEMALVEITDIVGKDFHDGRLPIGVFLDLSKTVDDLDHGNFLKKLDYYGFKYTELTWFKGHMIET